MQVSDQTSANMESESYQELSAASLRWQSTAIPIPAIAVAAYQIYVASMLSMKNSLEQFAEVRPWLHKKARAGA